MVQSCVGLSRRTYDSSKFSSDEPKLVNTTLLWGAEDCTFNVSTPGLTAAQRVAMNLILSLVYRAQRGGSSQGGAFGTSNWNARMVDPPIGFVIVVCFHWCERTPRFCLQKQSQCWLRQNPNTNHTQHLAFTKFKNKCKHTNQSGNMKNCLGAAPTALKTMLPGNVFWKLWQDWHGTECNLDYAMSLIDATYTWCIRFNFANTLACFILHIWFFNTQYASTKQRCY